MITDNIDTGFDTIRVVYGRYYSGRMTGGASNQCVVDVKRNNVIHNIFNGPDERRKSSVVLEKDIFMTPGIAALTD